MVATPTRRLLAAALWQRKATCHESTSPFDFAAKMKSLLRQILPISPTTLYLGFHFNFFFISSRLNWRLAIENVYLMLSFDTVFCCYCYYFPVLELLNHLRPHKFPFVQHTAVFYLSPASSFGSSLPLGHATTLRSKLSACLPHATWHIGSTL